MRRYVSAALIALALGAATLGGCQRQSFDVDDELLRAYRTRIASAPARRAADPDADAGARPVGGATTTRPSDYSVDDAMASRSASRVVPMRLQEVLRRGMANSYDIKVEGYNPGITAADVVAAEAAFDAVVFLEYRWSKLDIPTNNTLFSGGDQEISDFSGGVRKPLASGGEVSAAYHHNRTWTNSGFQRFNAAYDSDMTLELRQPLLRGFGLDVNRASIYIARNNRDISAHQFRRTVMDVMTRTEEAYWNLYFARQSLAIQKTLLGQSTASRDKVKARLELDALPSTLKQVESAVATRQARAIRLAANVRDAEDQLKNQLNDPDLPLNEDLAIVPADDPLVQRVATDARAEVWTGMENRDELKEARLAIQNASVTRGVAKNQLLPRLDAFLQWNVNALGNSSANSNHDLGTLDFQDYVVGLSFEFPIGNRAAEAGVRKSQLQLEQAVTAYHNLAADIMTEIRIAVRDVQTSYDEILANRAAVDAARDELETLQKRIEGLTPEYLEVELRAQETLAEARRALQLAIVNYNTAIVRLERAKGTLLRYNRVKLVADDE